MPEPTYGSLVPERQAALRGESEEAHSLPDLQKIGQNTSDQKNPEILQQDSGIERSV